MRRLLLLAFIWGWSFLLIKVAVRGMTPETVAGLRVVLGAVVLTVICRTRGVRLPRDRQAWRHFTVMAVVYSAVPFTLLAWGEQRIPSALASVGNSTTAIWTALLAALFLGDRFRRVQLIGLLLGLAGVGVAAGLRMSDLTQSSTVGTLAAVAAAACYGIGYIYARHHIGQYDPLVAATGQLLAGAAFMLPVVVGSSWASGIHLTPTRVIAIVILGTISTGLAYAVNYALIISVGATRASLVTYLVPVVAVTVGIAFLNEPFTWRLIIGGVFTVMGVALVQMRTGRLRRFGTWPLVGILLSALIIGGCSSTTASQQCGQPFQERLDPASAIHLLPAAPDPTYATDPPTSGAHRLTGLASLPLGVLDHPVPKGLQVALLEKGGVLVQYRAGDATSFSARLAALAQVSPLVTVAPAVSLPGRVVATAWTWKTVCAGPDTGALKAFIKRFAGHGPGTA